jgi:hypothetical protein
LEPFPTKIQIPILANLLPLPLGAVEKLKNHGLITISPHKIHAYVGADGYRPAAITIISTAPFYVVLNVTEM